MDLLRNEKVIEQSSLVKEPFYIAQGNEKKIFEAAYRKQLPVLLKGPTGCGKSRFVEHMAFTLQQPVTTISRDRDTGDIRAAKKDFSTKKGFLITIPCHEDLTANDLVGRFFLTLNEGDRKSVV